MPFHIAIDGPVAAGKGSVSRLVAERLGFLYVDTGAMYRVVALILLTEKHTVNFQQETIDEKGEAELVQLINAAQLHMRNPTESEKDGRLVTVIYNGKDISHEIRTEQVSRLVAKVASLAKVREALVIRQKEIAKNQNVVMEGRDIGSVVLPDAQLKIYLTASEIARAQRRHQQALSRGENVTLEMVTQDLLQRDFQDQNRKADPLRKVEGSWEVDTTHISIDQAVDLIVAKAIQLKEQYDSNT